MKKPDPTPFDFRRLMNMADLPNVDSLPFQSVTVGAAVNDFGLALVMLPEGGLDSLDLGSYSNLVIGPIENDWDEVALLIDRVRSIIEPPRVSGFYLRLDKRALGKNVVRMHARLEELFPKELRIVEEAEIAFWRKKFPSRIAMPDIPEPDAWAAGLLIGAAETAIFGELTASLENWGAGDKEQPASDAHSGALAKAFPTEPPKKPQPARLAPRRSVRRCKSEATAISFSKPHLHLVTVYVDEQSRLVIDRSRTRYLSFDGRDATSIRAIQKKVGDLLGQWDIRRVSMRVGLERGQYRLSTLAYKLEAALQLLDDLELRAFTTTEVMGFGRSFDEYLPGPMAKFAREGDRENQLNAIRTAGLAIFERGGRL